MCDEALLPVCDRTSMLSLMALQEGILHGKSYLDRAKDRDREHNS
jgi:hypothetical protein